MIIKKIQYLSPHDAWVICNDHKLFTCGTNEEYARMQGMIDNLPKDTELDITDLYFIADYIVCCSDVENWERTTGLTRNNFVEEVMYLLYKRVSTTFEIIQG